MCVVVREYVYVYAHMKLQGRGRRDEAVCIIMTPHVLAAAISQTLPSALSTREHHNIPLHFWDAFHQCHLPVIYRTFPILNYYF